MTPEWWVAHAMDIAGLGVLLGAAVCMVWAMIRNDPPDWRD